MHSMDVTTQNGQKSVNYVTVNYVTKIVIMAAIWLKMVRFWWMNHQNFCFSKIYNFLLRYKKKEHF